VLETVESQPFTFAHGVPDGSGGMLTAGQRTVRRKGDTETTTYDLVLPEGGLKKHAEDGVPAIERRHARTGEVMFQAWYSNGALLPGPGRNDDVPGQPKPQR
jgi:hypothetical protein